MGGVLEKEDNIIIDFQDSMYYLEISKQEHKKNGV